MQIFRLVWLKIIPQEGQHRFIGYIFFKTHFEIDWKSATEIFKPNIFSYLNFI